MIKVVAWVFVVVRCGGVTEGRLVVCCQVMGSDVTLTPDAVSLGVLVTSVPRDAVQAVINGCGVAAQRSDGKLPPYVTAYLTMALCLFPNDDYE